jgi:hypothetical protein
VNRTMRTLPKLVNDRKNVFNAEWGTQHSLHAVVLTTDPVLEPLASSDQTGAHLKDGAAGIGYLPLNDDM